MTIDLDLSGLIRAEAELKHEGVTLMRDSASVCQETAQRNARYRTGNMRRNIKLVPTDEGADVEMQDPISAFHEYGTGVYAGKADSDYPNDRPSSGSEADEIPWVYRDARTGQFYTTEGVRPAPMLRPGLADGRDYFDAEKKRRGL